MGGAVYILHGNNTFTNCIFVANLANRWGGGIFNSASSMTAQNCTFSKNTARRGGALSNFFNSNTHLMNCILWSDSYNEIHVSKATVTASHSNIQGGWPGEGNISVNPLFADPLNYDLHLKSQAGRWDPYNLQWIKDSTTSPCIDAGDLDMPVGSEPEPNSGRINMGAYGGTVEASKSF
jgi:hypothetical protein